MSKYQQYTQNNIAGRPDPKGPRGLYDDQITNHTKPLDALGRVFAKNPYSAIIQSVDNNGNLNSDLYISLPRRGNNDNVHGLRDQNLTDLHNALIDVINNPQDVSYKKQLLLEACRTKNTILHELLNSEEDFIRVQHRAQDISRDRYNAYYGYIQELKQGQTEYFSNLPNNSRRPGFLNELIQHQFDNFLSQNDLDLLGPRNLDIQNKYLIRVPYRDYYQNVHVEAKGVDYVHLQTGANTLYVGLGEKGGSREVGCCGKCCVEFGILEVDRDPAIIVYRTADYPSNIPEGVYAISPNIHDDESHFFDQRRMIEGSLKYLIKKGMRLNQEVGNLTQERNDLQTQVSDKDKEIQGLSSELETKKQEAEQLKEQSDKTKQEVEGFKKKLQEQEQQFEQQKAQLEEELEKGKKQLQEQEKQLEEAQNTATKLQAELIKIKEQALEEKQKKIKKQEEKLNSKKAALQEEETALQKEKDKLNKNNHHLKQADTQILSQDEDEQSYSLYDSLVAVNGISTLMDSFETESVVTADIDLKAIYVKEDMPQGRVVRVEFLAEYHHESDHGRNIQLLIESIESGSIVEDTVIAIERKSYGKSLGMPDVILLASIIEYNGQNPSGQLQIPEEIINGSLIYHDALLYKTAREHGVKIIGVEGRNLQADKIFSGEYDQAREEYMVDRIHQVARKGYNVIIHVGAAHVDSLRKFLTSFAEIGTSESSKWDRVLSEVAGSDFVGDAAESFDDMIFASCAHDYPSQEIDLIGNYTF